MRIPISSFNPNSATLKALASKRFVEIFRVKTPRLNLTSKRPDRQKQGIPEKRGCSGGGGDTTRPLPRDGGAEELRGDPTVGPHPKVWSIDRE